ncbi:MAG: hypothetical protein GX793_00440 [Bacteroidales bacterium]|nr:fibrobacter succinogenes major paralogous domain-containing protein [Bacteroidales bacterium]NLB85509.1 hypothetical protein [Bacteroidales bacterium]
MNIERFENIITVCTIRRNFKNTFRLNKNFINFQLKKFSARFRQAKVCRSVHYKIRQLADIVKACNIKKQVYVSYKRLGGFANFYPTNREVAKTALPGGYRNNNGNFNNLGNNGNWWSATENDSNNAWKRNLYYNNSNVNRNNNNKDNGYSVRCVRDFIENRVTGRLFACDFIKIF